MSAPDAPDNQRATVAGQVLLGHFAETTVEATIELPPNVTHLWVFLPPPPDPPGLSVVGATTGIGYPCYPFDPGPSTDPNLCVLCAVSPTVDGSVILNWGSSPGAPWYVVGDTGPRIVIDAALALAAGTPGFAAPRDAIQVAGTDGTTQRALLTDASGRLETVGTAFPPVYAPTGTTAPADALQVGGSDGANIRAVLVDAAGHQLTIDQVLKLAIGLPGVAVPANIVQVGGTDGANLRALLVDASGRVSVSDTVIAACIAVLAAAHPADAVQVAGNDGTALRALLTDASGHALVIDTKLEAAITTPGSAPTADFVAIGGSDGAVARAALLDASGRLLVIDSKLEAAIGLPTVAVPSDAVMTGWTDGVSLRVPITSKSALPYMIPSAPSQLTADRPPNELLWASTNAVAVNTNVVAAPGAGKRVRLYYVSAFPDTAAGEYALEATEIGGSTIFFCVNVSVPGGFVPPVQLPLTGMACAANTPVVLVIAAGQAGATVGYTIETV